MNVRTIARIIGACFVLADCSAPSVSPPLLVQTTKPYNGSAQTIPFTQQAYSGTLMVPAAISAPQGDTLTLISSQTPFSAPPTLQDARQRQAGVTRDVPLIYFELTASATTVFSALPTFSVHIPSSIDPGLGPFYVAFYDPTASPPAWDYVLEGPGVIGDSTVTFAPSNASPFTLQGGVHYFFAIYQKVTTNASPSPSTSAMVSAKPTSTASPTATATATATVSARVSAGPTATPSPTASATAGATPTPTPTLTPTPTPSPTPPGSLVLTSNTLSLNGAGSHYAQTTTLRESGYGGTFFESDSCSSIATIASSSGTGPSSTITVTGITSGTCSATFRDAYGQQATLSVSVTVSGFTISAIPTPAFTLKEHA